MEPLCPDEEPLDWKVDRLILENAELLRDLQSYRREHEALEQEGRLAAAASACKKSVEELLACGPRADQLKGALELHEQASFQDPDADELFYQTTVEAALTTLAQVQTLIEQKAGFGEPAEDGPDAKGEAAHQRVMQLAQLREELLRAVQAKKRQDDQLLCLQQPGQGIDAAAADAAALSTAGAVAAEGAGSSAGAVASPPSGGNLPGSARDEAASDALLLPHEQLLMKQINVRFQQIEEAIDQIKQYVGMTPVEGQTQGAGAAAGVVAGQQHTSEGQAGTHAAVDRA